MATTKTTAGAYGASAHAVAMEKTTYEWMLTTHIAIVSMFFTVADTKLTTGGEDAKTEQASPLQILLASSSPDEGPNTYTGPPIGFATSTVIHTSPYTGKTTESPGGITEVARLGLEVACTNEFCPMCRPPTTLVVEHKTEDGKVAMPSPIEVQGRMVYVECVDWQCVKCTPEANAGKMGGGRFSELMKQR